MPSELKKRTKRNKEKEQLLPEPGESGAPVENAEIDKPKAEGSTVPLRYGPMPTFSGQRLWSRSALIIGLMAIVYFNSPSVKESSFGKFDENIQGRAFDTKCSDDYLKETKHYKGCQPAKCGRILADLLDGTPEIFVSSLAKRIFAYGGERSGVYDLLTGKLLHDQESDLLHLNTGETKKIFQVQDGEHLQSTSNAVHQMISQHFKIDSSKLRLNTALFTRLTPTGKKKDHLLQLLVHQKAFSSHFSAIIYLSDFGKDYTGGRLIFPDSDSKNRTVEGRKGRVLAFTSGDDNQYAVERVTKGGLITLVLGFTCNPKEKVRSPKFPKFP